MQEILNKRTYNAKHFDKGDGSFVLEAHSGHIHYKDGEEFKPLDWTLIFDDVKRGWGFSTHSYNPFLPEYSDGWAEFRDRFHDKDQTVRYKAIVQNIAKGELIETDETNPNFDDNIDNKGVLYRNAFGENRDYILYNTRSSMVKVATVNNPNDCTADAVFEWEIEFPDKELFRVDKKEDAEDMTRLATKTNTEAGKLVGYKLEKRDGKNLNTNKLTLIGNSNLDGKEWYTYLKSFKAWDSEGKTIEIVARISFVNGKAILKKTIPLEFLKAAVGRVFTDTTTSYYAVTTNADGRIYSGPAAWSDARTASSGTYNGNQAADTVPQVYWTGSQYYISRAWFAFDTSGIPDTDTVSASAFYVYSSNSGVDSETTYKSNLALVVGTQASTSSLANDDFDQVGSTRLADTDIPFSSFKTSGQYYFTLNSSGLSAINKTGYTKLAIRPSNELDNNQPTASSQWNMYFSEQTGTTYDPYLEVTYSAGGGSTWTPKIIIF